VLQNVSLSLLRPFNVQLKPFKEMETVSSTPSRILMTPFAVSFVSHPSHFLQKFSLIVGQSVHLLKNGYNLIGSAISNDQFNRIVIKDEVSFGLQFHDVEVMLIICS
jgi:hypothetical protein